MSLTYFAGPTSTHRPQTYCTDAQGYTYRVVCTHAALSREQQRTTKKIRTTSAKTVYSVQPRARERTTKTCRQPRLTRNIVSYIEKMVHVLGELLLLLRRKHRYPRTRTRATILRAAATATAGGGGH